eukprot:1085523-Pyramimonas_sp.AAC.1
MILVSRSVSTCLFGSKKASDHATYWASGSQEGRRTQDLKWAPDQKMGLPALPSPSLPHYPPVPLSLRC